MFNKTLKIVSIKVIKPFTLNIVFNDDTCGDTDFTKYIDYLVNFNHIFKPLLEQAFFEKAYLEQGMLRWPPSEAYFGFIELMTEAVYALTHKLPIPQSVEQEKENFRIVHERCKIKKEDQTDPKR